MGNRLKVITLITLPLLHGRKCLVVVLLPLTATLLINSFINYSHEHTQTNHLRAYRNSIYYYYCSH